MKLHPTLLAPAGLLLLSLAVAPTPAEAASLSGAEASALRAPQEGGRQQGGGRTKPKKTLDGSKASKKARGQRSGKQDGGVPKVNAGRKRRGDKPALQPGGADAPSGKRLEREERQRQARIEAARQQDTAQKEATALRAQNARDQKALTEAERAQRIANARKSLADLDARQAQVAKRFMLEQEKHLLRLAKLDRIEALLSERRDESNLARVAALRTKEKAAFEGFKAAAREALNASQLSAVESAGVAGTRPRASTAERAAKARQKGAGAGPGNPAGGASRSRERQR